MLALRRLFTWLLGPLPDLQRGPDSASAFVVVIAVGVVAMWLDTRHTFRPPDAEHTWTFAVYGVLPLAAVVCWEVRDSEAMRIAAGICAAVVATPLLLRVVAPDSWGTGIEEHAPVLLGVTAWVGVALLLIGRQGGMSLEDWGLGFGDWRWWLPRFGLVAVLMELMVIGAAWGFPDFRAYYPEYDEAKTSVTALIRYQAWLGVYMFGWEAFFRGFLLRGVARRGDVLMALTVPAIPFFLLHWHKPEIEMLASFVGSIGACWFCLNARSFWPVFLMHWAMNLSMEVTCFVWRQVGTPVSIG